MSDCVLLLCWPDFAVEESVHPEFAPPLVAHALQRHLSLRFGAFTGYFWHPQQERFARSAIPMTDGSYRLDMTPDSANYALFAFGA